MILRFINSKDSLQNYQFYCKSFNIDSKNNLMFIKNINDPSILPLESIGVVCGVNRYYLNITDSLYDGFIIEED